MTTITEYLDGIISITGGDQKRYYEWVRKKGRNFLCRNKIREHELVLKCEPHKRRECYYNSQSIVLGSNIYDYYEGWYIPSGLFPLEHGFVVYNSQVVDVTANNRIVEEYFGVKIPKRFVWETWNRTMHAPPLIADWWSQSQKGVKKTMMKNGG